MFGIVILTILVIIFIVYVIQQARNNNNSTQHYPLQPSSRNKYICNRKTNVFHRPDCPCVKDKYDSKGEYVKQEYNVSYKSMIDAGFRPCTKCNPK